MSRINNTFQFSGNVGTPPEIRSISADKKVAEISLGVDASYRDKDGERVERTDWFDVVTYAPGLLSVVEKHLAKGREITVRGYVRKNKWESKDRKNADGSPAIDSRLELVMTEMKFHGKATKAGEPGDGESFTGESPED